MLRTSSVVTRSVFTRARIVAAMLVVAVALLWSPTGNALADGGGVTILQRDVPPFHVRMDGATDQPTVGQWHLTFFVTSLQTGKPVYDAHLTVIATLQQSGTSSAGNAVAPRMFESYQCQYRNDCQDLNATFDTAGDYDFVAKISTATSTASFPFTYRVQPSSLDLGRITGNGLVIIVALAAIYTTRYWWINRIRKLLGKPPIERKRERTEEEDDSATQ